MHFRSQAPAARGLSFALLALVVLSMPFGTGAQNQHRAPWEKEPPPEPDYPDLIRDVEWLASQLDSRDVLIVDARPADAYLGGHIRGAISVPLDAPPDMETLPGILGSMGITGRERILCYGDDSRSGASARLFWLFELAGAGRVFMLEGGVRAWTASGRELTTRLATRPAARWAPEPDDGVLATREYVRRSFGREGFEIFDARGREAWNGPLERSEWGSTKRVGHIPHALPFDWWAFFEPDGTLKRPSDAWFTFAALGPRPANPVDVAWEFIVYGDGVSGDGALGYFLLRRAGVSSVRYYPGGWDDWAESPYLPVVRNVGAEELQWRLAKARRWLKPDAPPEIFAFFDVRHPADHTRGHIPGAVSLRSDYFADSLDIKMERYWPSLDRTVAPVVTYCYGEQCIRSRATSTAAAREGFVYAERFYGGLDEWYGIGGKVVRAN